MFLTGFSAFSYHVRWSACIYFFLVNQMIVKFWFYKCVLFSQYFKICKKIYIHVVFWCLTPNWFHLHPFGDLGLYTALRWFLLCTSWMKEAFMRLWEYEILEYLKRRRTPKHTVSIWAKAVVLNDSFKTKALGLQFCQSLSFLLGQGKAIFEVVINLQVIWLYFSLPYQSNWHLSSSSRNVIVMMMCEMKTRQLAFQTRQAGTQTNLL